ncbi:hypothetical protein CHUAL_008938 [Chamberlinius hualienensis]
MHNFKSIAKGQQDNTEQLKRQKQIVEDAIQHLNAGKQQVEDYIVKTKQEVELSVNNIYDQLRQREIQLLRQIDVFNFHYWSKFQTQNAKLHQMLGTLTQALNCNSTDISFPKEDVQLVEEVCRQKFLKNSVMSFDGNVDDVCQQLNKFGKLVSNNYFDLNTIDDGLKSKCLPEKLEEYDDPEHQLLYKTLQDLQLSEMSDEDDWLRPTVVNLSENRFQMPDYFENEDLSYWLRDSSAKKSSKDDEDLRKRFEIIERLSFGESEESIELISNFESDASSQATKACGSCCDIENLGDVTCDSPCNDFINKWLTKGNSYSINRLIKSQQLNMSDFCMANECCSNFDQCVCRPLCTTKAFKLSQQQQNQWLKNAEIKTTKFDYFPEKFDFSEKDPNYFLRSNSQILSKNVESRQNCDENINWLNSNSEFNIDGNFIRKDFQIYFNSSDDYTNWLMD